MDKACKEICKQTFDSLEKQSEEIKKNSEKYKCFSEDIFNEIFGDNGDLK